jgi:TatA/E family protein of Tat protein translocase
MYSSHLLFLQNIFSTDGLLIAFIALLLFGGEKLPELARGLGKGLRDFKDASEGVKREINAQINSFEEKRAEEALDKKAEEHNQLTANTGNNVEIRPLVENTMPINDNYFSQHENTPADAQPEAHAELVTEHHENSAKADHGTTNNEPIKNS